MASDQDYGLTPATTPPSAAPASNPYGLEPIRQNATPTTDQRYGLTPASTPIPASIPAHDPNARFAFGTGTISAYQPTVWDRIRNAVTAGIPIFHGSRFMNPRDPKYGQMQLIAPEEAMSETEQHEHPTLTALGEAAGGMTTAENVAILYGTAGLGELPGAARILPRLISAGFGSQAVLNAYRSSPAIRAAWNRGDAAEVERLFAHGVLDLSMAALAGQHAATGEGAVTGRRAPEPMQPVMETPTAPHSPISEVLHESAPDVRVADSSAAAHDLIEKDTLVPPKIEVGAVNDPALADIQAQVRGRADEIAKKYPIQTVARVVNDAHVPVVTQSEVLAEAVQRMVNNSGELLKAGVDPSQIQTPADAEAMLQKAADHVARNIDPRTATITFEAQRSLAESLGMTVEELLSRKSGQAFNAEQAIAARALLNDSGLNVVKSAQRAVTDPEALPDMTRALAQHQAIIDAVKGMTAEAGRSLGSFRMSDLPASRIADAMSKLDPDAQAEAAKLLAKTDVDNPRAVNAFVEKITPSSTADKLFELYRNSLLSGPATVIKKGVSESTMLALEATKKLVAAGLSKVKGGEEQRYASESYWFAKGAMDALQHTKAVLSGDFDLADAPDFERTGQRAIKGKIGDIVRFPSTVLSRQTNLMYVMNYFGELNAQAARAAISEGLKGPELAARQEYLVQHPTEEMTDGANDTALHNTFQSELGKFGKSVQKTIQSEPTGALKYLLPFFKTPINLAKESAYYSPYGLFKGTLKGDVDMQARGIVGSSLAAGIAYLALNNHITGGGPVDAKKRETLEATGWQPYSVKIGNKYISYRRLEPVGLTFALVADAVHSMSRGDPEVVSQSKADTAVAHIARSLQDVAFVPTLSNLAEAMTNPGARGKAFISREAGSLVPALVKDVAQASDLTVRRPSGIAQTLESRIPGLTRNVPAVIDITGKPVQRPVSALGGANPFPFSTATNDPVVAELARLGISTPQPPTQIKWRGKPTPLTDSERQAFAQEEGRELYNRVSKVIQSGSWQKRTDDQKRKALVELHRMIDESRPARLTKLRRQTQAELASR